MKRRIRILFANCPHLDVAACSYLVLAQNAVQDVFEFEVYHVSVYAAKAKLSSPSSRFLERWSESTFPLPLKQWAARQSAAYLERRAIPPLSKPLPLDECGALVWPFLRKHDEWLESLPANSYGNWSIRPAPIVLITETPLDRYYFGWCEGPDLAIASIKNWRRRHTPPSLLEYVLAQVQRYAIRVAVCPDGVSHYPTRACLWDFDPNVSDARISLLVGYLCSACEERLKEYLPDQEVSQIRKLLDHRWIGKVEEPGSVASNLKRVFNYDLSRTKGLAPTIADQIRSVGVSEVVKLIAAGFLGFFSLQVLAQLKSLLVHGSAWFKK